MLTIPRSEAIVIGSGPNGLAAAIALAQAGRSVTVVEGAQQIGGSVRSAQLTLPGFVHDVCSAVYPLSVTSPFFRSLPLAEHGLKWIDPEVPLAHPLDDGSVVLLEGDASKTAAALGKDGEAYLGLIGPVAENWTKLAGDLLAPLHWPSHPLVFARFGLNAFASAVSLCKRNFRSQAAKALLAGMAAHSMMSLDRSLTAAFALVLAAAGHAVSWPFAQGGAQTLTHALAGFLRSLGGNIVTGTWVNSLDDLPPARTVMCAITPRQLLRIADQKLPLPYRRQLQRYRYGVGAFKVDWALSAPVPWRSQQCLRAGTLHLGGTLEEIAAAEAEVWDGRAPQRPFVIFAQPSLSDPSRAPAGAHTAWAYCHVPHASTANMTERIELQVERFAPGFRRLILARSEMGPRELEAHNPNIVGGDINGGVQDLWQMFLRPTRKTYVTPVKGLYLCSSSTPPGGGVHGMCGYFAAKAALRLS